MRSKIEEMAQGGDWQVLTITVFDRFNFEDRMSFADLVKIAEDGVQEVEDLNRITNRRPSRETRYVREHHGLSIVNREKFPVKNIHSKVPKLKCEERAIRTAYRVDKKIGEEFVVLAFFFSLCGELGKQEQQTGENSICT